MSKRVWATGGALFGLLAGLSASCFVPESDTYPDGVKKSAFVGSSTSSSGGGGGGAPICGDNTVNAGTNEACDDGNTAAGDGCDASCQVESCFTCPASGGACTALAAGTVCPTNAMQVCDGQGACVPCLPAGTTCMGAGCRFCPGVACTGAMDECASGFCVDGVCCDAACDGACQACDFPGLSGTCLAPVPNGWQEMGCMGTDACQAGSCTPLNMKAPVRGFCTKNQDCFNNTCVAGVCRLQTDDPCSEDAQCETNYCNAEKKCAGCTDGNQCASGSCSGGICLAMPGAPCSSMGLGCANGASCGIICKASNGSPCQGDHECTSNLCLNGTCAPCDAMNAPCPNGGVCSFGACPGLGIPQGELCASDAFCTSMTCKGFPPRCQ